MSDKERTEDLDNLLDDLDEDGCSVLDRFPGNGLSRRAALAIRDLERQLAESRARAEAAERDAKALRDALEHDRTQVALGVTAVKKAVASRTWLTEGRGPYAWNDDDWHKEFAAAAEEILAAIEPLAKIAADWTDCSRNHDDINRARASETLCLAAPPAPAETWKVGDHVICEGKGHKNERDFVIGGFHPEAGNKINPPVFAYSDTYRPPDEARYCTLGLGCRLTDLRHVPAPNHVR